MPTTPKKRRVDEEVPTCLVPDNVYPLRSFLKVTGLSMTTLWRAENLEGVKLHRIRSGGKVYIEGRDGIRFLKERAEKQSAAKK